MTHPSLQMMFHVRDSKDDSVHLLKARSLYIGTLTEEQVEEQAVLETRNAIRTIFNTERP
jgi:hypothetical protein